MEHQTEPTLFAFLLQILLFSSYIPISYLAYRSVRAPLRHDKVKQSLLQLGFAQTGETEETIPGEFHPKDYLWPLFTAWLLTTFFFSVTHPYLIQRGWWAGLLEEIIDLFGADNRFVGARAILAGRFLWWGWLGAYVYSFHLTARRYLAYDLTPSVYIFTTNRFALAFAIVAIVGVGVSTFSTAAGMPFDMNFATVSIIAFFIGFFPEQGIAWITTTAKTFLKLQGSVVKEIPLSHIEGLSIWHQGRLSQEGIENVQNLATADVPHLVVNAPFAVAQIVDWIDQAILLRCASEAQCKALEKAGIISAADVLASTDSDSHLKCLAKASGLGKEELEVLRICLQSSSNIQLVARFRWQSSMNAAQRNTADKLCKREL